MKRSQRFRPDASKAEDIARHARLMAGEIAI
jgi:hypothetical protein